MLYVRRPLALLALLALAACSAQPDPISRSEPTPSPVIVLADGATASLPAVEQRLQRFREALAVPPYILALPGLDAPASAAQDNALADERVQRATQTPDGQRLRAEVITVSPSRAGDLPPALGEGCVDGCTRVVVYVHPTATTITAAVSAAGDVLDVQSAPNAQPEVSGELAQLATAIAIAAPATARALGVTPDEAMALMSATKTTVEGTACERRRHLCVAPVFTWGERALWTIVDLTDYALVAASAWTEQGASGRRVVSEATLQDAALGPLCDTPGRIERDGWSLAYLLTSSDGLELRDVAYQGRPLLASVKVVDWHVGYAASGDQRVGFSDAIGCPVFSSAAVIPYGPPRIEGREGGGFTLAITFRSPNWPQPCNYQYTFLAEFAPDGTLIVLPGNEGRGCGTEGLYHPVIRIEPSRPVSSMTVVDEGARAPVSSEGWQEWAAGGSERVELAADAGPISLSPVWGDADRIFVYWTAGKDAEGRGDLPSIGTCCNRDERQGPEQFTHPPEPLGSEPVLWFVPQIRNAERSRCWADSRLVDGLLTADVWPCRAGVSVRAATP